MTPEAQKNSSARKIASLWMEVSRMVHCYMAAQWKEDGVNPLQLFALFVIREHAGLTMKEFAQHMHITAPSATAMANRLFKLKWINRKTDARNRKLVRLRISKLGEKMLTTHLEHHRLATEGILSLLDATDRKDAARILQNVHSALLHLNIS